MSSSSKHETVKATYDPESGTKERRGKRKELGKMGREEEVAKHRTRCFIVLGHGGTPPIGENCPELYASKGPPGYYGFFNTTSIIKNIIEISRPWKGKKGKSSSLKDHIDHLNENATDLGDHTPAYDPHDPFGEHTIWRTTKTDMICEFSGIDNIKGCTDCNDPSFFDHLYQPYGIYDITNYEPPPKGAPPPGIGEAYFRRFQASREGAMNITDNVMDVCRERGMKDVSTDTDIPPRTDEDCSTVGSVSRSCTKCGIKHWRPRLLVSQIQIALESLYPNTTIHLYSNLCRGHVGAETPGTPAQHMAVTTGKTATGVKLKGHAKLQALGDAAAAGDATAAAEIPKRERAIRQEVILANLEDGISAIGLGKKKKRKKHTHKPKHKKKRGQARSRGSGRGSGRGRGRGRGSGRSSGRGSGRSSGRGRGRGRSHQRT